MRAASGLYTEKMVRIEPVWVKGEGPQDVFTVAVRDREPDDPLMAWHTKATGTLQELYNWLTAD
mgnify:CR=1 FL=1